MTETTNPALPTGVKSREQNVLMRAEDFELLAGRLALVLDEFEAETAVPVAKIAAGLQFFVGSACGSAGYMIHTNQSVADQLPIFTTGYNLAIEEFKRVLEAARAEREAANDAPRIALPGDPA